ncbi:MAG: DNA ligase D [Myxococcota bacterium]
MSPEKSRSDIESALGPYHQKRRADGTPEPYGTTPRAGGPRFVVQKHAATRTHYDFRLEFDGVLKSWALPKAPSLDPTIKRLAVRTEDHPLDYADFEGVIPEGNYGAGAVIVWDEGRLLPIDEPGVGFDQGKLLFDLEGAKLRGRWTLVRTRRNEGKDWLLIKKPDGWSGSDKDERTPDVSVLSGLSVEELPRRAEKRAEAMAQLAALPAFPNRTPSFALARKGEGPWDRPGWIYELKYDGFRLMLEKRGEVVKLRFRSGGDAARAFPELVRIGRRLPAEHLVLDGEVVVLNADGRPSFQRLQKRVQLDRDLDIARASTVHPVTLQVFDLLGLEKRDLRGEPLLRRKALLKGVVPPLGSIRFADHVEEQGDAFLEQVRRMELEGMMAKDGRASYPSGRSDAWLKVPLLRREEFVVVGFTKAKGNRVGFGGLHLASFVGSTLHYQGRVGSGFDGELLRTLREELEAEIMPEPGFENAPPRKDARWVRPRLVCEVRFLSRTEEGLLRQPVFLGLRPDKALEDLVEDEHELGPTPPEPPESREREVALVNLTKVFWPREGYTKADLLEYHRTLSDWLVPLLADRPAVLTRYPDGIDGKSFFQKNTPGFAPEWLRRARLWSEHAEREIDYLVLEDLPSLEYAVNSGAIPLHVWGSRLTSLQTPDWLIVDFDPKAAPFTHVVTLARALHRLCEEIGLPSMAKTSGATGLHVLIPLGRQLTFEQTRQLGTLLARVLVDRHPDLATVDRMIQARGRKVYVDVLQNGHGRLLVSAYSVRPLPGAPVSTPLHWREVDHRLDPKRFDLRTVPKRLVRQKKDPLEGLLSLRPELLQALEALQTQFEV